MSSARNPNHRSMRSADAHQLELHPDSQMRQPGSLDNSDDEESYEDEEGSEEEEEQDAERSSSPEYDNELVNDNDNRA